MRKTFLSFFILFFVCCRQPSVVKEQISLKDSVVKKHFAAIDSLDYFDTTNQHYRILKAYINNDTDFFADMNRELEMHSKYIYRSDFDSCIHLQKLPDLPVVEAYRFSHGQSFCSFMQRITITRTRDTVQLHYLEFGATDDGRIEEYVKDGKRIVIGQGCAVVKEFQKSISFKDWEDLAERLYNADYWGLKPNHYSNHTDGSSWRIEACIRDKWTSELKQTYSVSRHCSCSPAFEELGRYFLTLSGEKTMCGDFF